MCPSSFSLIAALYWIQNVLDKVLQTYTQMTNPKSYGCFSILNILSSMS